MEFIKISDSLLCGISFERSRKIKHKNILYVRSPNVRSRILRVIFENVQPKYPLLFFFSNLLKLNF